MNYFQPVTSWSVERVRKFLEQNDPEDFNLVDVRQPREYERGHLPGAQLIPVGEIGSRTGELDPEKPTIAY